MAKTEETKPVETNVSVSTGPCVKLKIISLETNKPTCFTAKLVKNSPEYEKRIKQIDLAKYRFEEIKC